MEDKAVQKKLENLQVIKAPTSLHQKMQQQVNFLPEKHKGFYFPLFAFRLGMVAAVILFVVATSGILVAASTDKTPLYPVKVLMQKVAPAFIEQKEVTKAVAPTATPIPTTAVSTPSGEEALHHEDHEDHEERHLQALPTIVQEYLKKVESLKQKIDPDHGDNRNESHDSHGNSDDDSHHGDHGKSSGEDKE